jgi:hypothetical protein
MGSTRTADGRVTASAHLGIYESKATTIELASSHVSLVSHPKEIADLILLAAGCEKLQ